MKAKYYGAAAAAFVVGLSGMAGAVVATPDITTTTTTEVTTTSVPEAPTTAPVATTTVPSTTTTTQNTIVLGGVTTTTQDFYGAPVPTTVPPATAIVPNLIGMQQEQVKPLLIGLNIGPGSYMDKACYGSQYAPDTVVRQSPSPGKSIVADWDPVNMTASATVEYWVEDDSGC